MKSLNTDRIKKDSSLKNTIHSLNFLILLLLALAGCASIQPHSEKTNMWARAARLGDIETLRQIEKNQNKNYNDTDANGVTTLMIASRFGQIETVRFLLNQGAKADSLDHDKQSALDYVLYANLPVDTKRSITQFLIEKGADPFRTNFLDLAPIYEMVSNGFLAEIKTLKFSEKSACDRLVFSKPESSIVKLAMETNHIELAHFLESIGCP